MTKIAIILIAIVAVMGCKPARKGSNMTMTASSSAALRSASEPSSQLLGFAAPRHLPEESSNVLTYEKARLRCVYKTTANLDLEIDCYAVELQPHGDELRAVQRDAGLTVVSFNVPLILSGDLTIRDCKAASDMLSYSCHITRNQLSDKDEILFSMHLSSAGHDARDESVVVGMSLTAGLAMGLVPQVPFSYVGSDENSTGVQTPIFQGFQSLQWDSDSINFSMIKSACLIKNRLFFIMGGGIFELAGGRITLYAGSENSGAKDNFTSRLRTFLQPDILACGTESLYVASQSLARVVKIEDFGAVVEIAGNGEAGNSPDDTPAKGARINDVRGLLVMPDGSVLFSEAGAHKIRMITPEGILKTVAGNGRSGRNHDGDKAAIAPVTSPAMLIKGTDGLIYFIERSAHVVQRISLDGTLKTIAGTGQSRSVSRDEGALVDPTAIAFDQEGTLYIAEQFRGIKKVTRGGGMTTFLASDEIDENTAAILLAGGQDEATRRRARQRRDVLLVGADGALYTNSFTGIAKYDVVTQKAMRVMGSMIEEGACNGGNAVNHFYEASALAVAPLGAIVFADYRSITSDQIVIRQIDNQTDAVKLNTLYGCDDPALLKGENRLGASAMMASNIGGLAAGDDGTIYLANSVQNRIIKITPMGQIVPFAGNGSAVSMGDGGAAMSAGIVSPMGIALASDGSLYIAERAGYRIRKVDPSGVITTVAGSGVSGDAGDGGPALSAQIRPFAIALDALDRLFIAEEWNNKIRMVDRSGVIRTIAGDGVAGFSSGVVNAEARSSRLFGPSSIAAGKTGVIYFVDFNNRQVKELVEADDGQWSLSSLFGAGAADDCATLHSPVVDGSSVAVKHTAAVLCQGVPRAVTVVDNCPSKEGKTRIFITQTFGEYSNIIELIKACP